MELSVLDELSAWFKHNVFDEPVVTPEERTAQLATLKAAEEEDVERQASGGLTENARLYHWCPRRKRLVESA